MYKEISKIKKKKNQTFPRQQYLFIASDSRKYSNDGLKFKYEYNVIVKM